VSDSPVGYPATLSIDVKEAERDKVSVGFRPFVAIPILIILGLLTGASFQWEHSMWNYEMPVAGLVPLPTLLMILFQQKYPRWWFDWNLALARFGTRVAAFMTLLHDDYPSTDELQYVHLDIPYPDVKAELNRWMPLVKWFLAIPHLFILAFLSIAVFFCTVFAWFAILFTGRYPQSLVGFIVGYLRWEVRVAAYAFLLTTDIYPPFSLEA